MRQRDEVTSEKLRGGFYSPPALVCTCIDRIEELLPGRDGWRVLEPAVGDGAFIEGLASRARRVASVTGVEVVPTEADKARRRLDSAHISGTVIASSFVPWAVEHVGEFDAAVGNPPFVRFQFVDEDPEELAKLGEELGVSFRGVSNLWIPIFLGALAALSRGGAFAFIIPSECFTGVSAKVVRAWLIRHADLLSVDLFPVGSFPGVLQEVVVLSGIRTEEGSGELRVREHRHGVAAREWCHVVDGRAETWTRYLLEPEQVQAFDHAATMRSIRRLGDVARIEVATVTGANSYFSVDDSTLHEFSLEPWGVPLLPRIRHAPSLDYSHADHLRAQLAGAKTWLLDFSADKPDPMAAPGPRRYLELGLEAELHRRFKTRIREPWYRVPGIKPGALLLSKRSHRYPRLIVNSAGVATTDTIYRGWMRPTYTGRERALVAGFHNSLTLLAAEIEGRSFGGGVLELVPSEIARLLVVVPDGLDDYLPALANHAATVDDELPDALIAATNRLLQTVPVGFDVDMVELWESARQALQRRRLDRAATVEPRLASMGQADLIAV